MLFSDGLILVGGLLVGMSVISFITIRKYRRENYSKFKEIQQKNIYLEHAAKIIRHDMHSGINTYLPRGVISLERRIPKEIIKEYKLGPSLRLLKEGLDHTRKVYEGVYAFTDLVKFDKKLPKQNVELGKILNGFLEKTAYSDQIDISLNLNVEINVSLFCTAIDNLIRNGLKYNDSKTKFVKVYSEENAICIEDNGRGLSEKDFLEYSKPYSRKDNQKEPGSGLGLNIAKTIFNEHGFKLEAEKITNGTIMRVIIK